MSRYHFFSRALCLFFLVYSFSGWSKTSAAARVVEMKVTTAGYVPKKVEAKSGEKIKFQITRVTDATCATEILIPDLKVNKVLPLNKTVSFEIGPLKKGTHRFGCGMNLMIDGTIEVAN